jgi:hypothetical protein
VINFTQDHMGAGLVIDKREELTSIIWISFGADPKTNIILLFTFALLLGKCQPLGFVASFLTSEPERL